MAFTAYSDYKASRPYAWPSLAKTTTTTIAGRSVNRWALAPFAGTVPTTAAVPTAATLGALNGSPAGLAAWIKRARMASFAGASILIFDRLSHQGGLSATSVAVQTTNLPTAALTRYTSGVGVHIALQIYTVIGTSGTTVSCSYTNSAGVAARTSPLITIGATNERGVGSFLSVPLQQGDVGVRSVESVTMTASTGTVGAFGVVLYKPLAMIIKPYGHQHAEWDAVRDGGCMFEGVVADACLDSTWAVDTTPLGSTSGVLELIKQV